MSSGSPVRDEAGASGRTLAAAKGLVRRLRWWPDRVLHPWRRRRARRQLQEAPIGGHVLFLCHGNICRSPYAERVFLRHPAVRLPATSAGLAGPGRPPPVTAIHVAAERGVELADHRSRLASDALLRQAGLVVVMERRQSRFLRRRYGVPGALVLGDLDPGPIPRRSIRDPIFQSADVFRSVYDRIDRCVETLAMLIGSHGTGTSRSPRPGSTGRG